jgi:hypothetical protein
MTIPHDPVELPQTAATRAECPEPISLETLAVIEQVLAQMLGELRGKLKGSLAAQQGAIEYASWLPQRH